MTFKTIVRFLIGLFLAGLLLNLLLPAIGVPRALLSPPPYAFANATGKTQGIVVRKFKKETSDPFHVGDKISYVEYQFRAPYTPVLFGDQKSNPQKRFTGVATVSAEAYNQYQPNLIVPIRYETSYPEISGIPGKFGGRNEQGVGNWFSGWIGWTLLTILLGYGFSMSLERFLLRESY